MSKLGSDPGATRKPPAWLVFEDDSPWLSVAGGSELSDLSRGHQLFRFPLFPWTKDLVNDRQRLFFVWAVTDPGEQEKVRITRYGDKAFGTGKFPDSPERPFGDEFDAWIEPQVRAALESYRRPPPGQE